MSIVIMILLLSVLILVHELGHFAAARMFGITVEKFGFGLPFGPTLWEKKIGETTYVVHAFLLGGYVSFPDDNENPEITDDPGLFKSKPVWQRMVVISAGVIANVICAFALVVLTAALWGNLPSGKYDTYIKKIVAPKDAPVWVSGLQTGDRIAQINGSVISTKYGLPLYSRLNAAFDGKVNPKTVEQNYMNLKKINHAFTQDEIIPKDVAVRLPDFQNEAPVRLTPNMLKGIEMPQTGDVELNEKQIKLRDEILDKKYFISDGSITLNDVASAMSDGLKPLFIKVARRNDIVALKPVYPGKDGLIGVELQYKEILIPVHSPRAVLASSRNYLYNETYSMLVVLKQLFTGKVPLKNLHGVVLITKIGGDIIHDSGMYYGLLLTAMISMNLAIINFLPFPALDGGHFMFLLIEKITGKAPDEKILNAISNIGFWILIALMAVVIFNDIVVLIGVK